MINASVDDEQLIRSNLAKSGIAEAFDRPWTERWYIIAYCFVPAVLLFVLGIHEEKSKWSVILGQFALAIGTFQALIQLSNRPLLNPIQAVVFLFHWWFAVGPGAAVLLARLRSDSAMLEKYVAVGGESLWIVAIGLPIYALFANASLRWSRGKVRHLAFLMPEGPLYRPSTLYAYWLVGGGLTLVTVILGKFGIIGGQTVNYLGGKVSENWFVSALEAIGAISIFATVGVMAYLAGPVQRGSARLKTIAIALILIGSAMALTAGWKGAIVQNFVLLVIVILVWRQKAPLVLVAILVVSYLFIVEPYVRQARFAAEIANITTPEERAELFRDTLSMGISMSDIDVLDVNIESPFRGVYEFANGIASESSMLTGPWSDTISEGVLALIPRALYPEKPEGHIGNFIARYLGNAAPDNYEQNIGVSIPFEIVGNYGYIMGIVSFMCIGVLWALFNVWLLSEKRLATHPLMPLCIINALRLEQPIGAYLVWIRDLPLLLGTAYVVWLILKRRL